MAVLRGAAARGARAGARLVVDARAAGAAAAAFAVAMGVLVAAVERGRALGGSARDRRRRLRAAAGAGARSTRRSAPTSADRTRGLALRPPDRRLRPRRPAWATSRTRGSTGDLTVARDFDLGMTGPPLSTSTWTSSRAASSSFVGRPRLARCCCSGFAWWAPLVLAGAWLATHWLLRESAVWRDRNTDEVREAQRHADYAYRLAVDPPAAKELRLFGLAGLDARPLRRRGARCCTSCSTTPRGCASGRSPGACCSCVGANVAVFWALADAARRRAGSTSARVVTFAQAAVGVERDRLRRAELGARRRGRARRRRAPPRAGDGRGRRPAPRGSPRRPARPARARDPLPRRQLRLPEQRAARCSTGFDLTIPAGHVARDRRARTARARPRSPSCSAASTTRRRAPSRSTASTCATLDVDGWRRARHRRVPGLHPLRAAAARQRRARPARPTTSIRAALADAGAAELADLDTPLARGYAGGTDLSGGQWQRVALARALCAVRARRRRRAARRAHRPARRARRGRDLRAHPRRHARTCTTILISHRFSTVRHADRICVLEHGRVVELGTHDELMALRRPLPHDVRPAGPALRRGRRRTRKEVAYDVRLGSTRPTAARAVRRCGGCCKLGYRHEPGCMLGVVRALAAGGAARRAASRSG